MIESPFSAFLENKRCTLLGVGPMSQNCIDAAIDISNDFEIPLMLIASRRQIDSEHHGGGYVNNWTTEQFAGYVRDADLKGKLLLARDHGGPWQNSLEVDQELNLQKAMLSAKSSYCADIDAGFQVLHIDPSIDIHATPTKDDVLDRLFELYEYCWSYAQRKNSQVFFEIGTEEQSGTSNTQEELNYTLSKVVKFCKKNKIPKPLFVVVQTGTRVMEMRNVGSFDAPLRVADEVPSEIQVPKMVEICQSYGIMMKEHNTDYLSNEALRWHPKLGIHSSNVAPEFGVTESRAFLELMQLNGLGHYADRFLELAYKSEKWEKWMLKNTSASEIDCALIAGHYIFSSSEFVELKNKVKSSLSKRSIDVDNYLKLKVQAAIMRYVYNFRMVLS